ncbi:hypothetical protein GH733_009994 [Mirounga leonina]|nr:hypothetical protein GH733_009994 [Mirounga leonina]
MWFEILPGIGIMAMRLVMHTSTGSKLPSGWGHKFNTRDDVGRVNYEVVYYKVQMWLCWTSASRLSEATLGLDCDKLNTSTETSSNMQRKRNNGSHVNQSAFSELKGNSGLSGLSEDQTAVINSTSLVYRNVEHFNLPSITQETNWSVRGFAKPLQMLQTQTENPGPSTWQDVLPPIHTIQATALPFSSERDVSEETIVTGERNEYLVTALEPDSPYRVCMVPMETSNLYLFDDTRVCIETETAPLRMYNPTTTLNREQEKEPYKNPNLPLAAIIGGAVALVTIALLALLRDMDTYMVSKVTLRRRRGLEKG